MLKPAGTEEEEEVKGEEGDVCCYCPAFSAALSTCVQANVRA